MGTMEDSQDQWSCYKSHQELEIRRIGVEDEEDEEEGEGDKEQKIQENQKGAQEDPTAGQDVATVTQTGCEFL